MAGHIIVGIFNPFADDPGPGLDAALAEHIPETGNPLEFMAQPVG